MRNIFWYFAGIFFVLNMLMAILASNGWFFDSNFVVLLTIGTVASAVFLVKDEMDHANREHR